MKTTTNDKITKALAMLDEAIAEINAEIAAEQAAASTPVALATGVSANTANTAATPDVDGAVRDIERQISIGLTQIKPENLQNYLSVVNYLKGELG